MTGRALLATLVVLFFLSISASAELTAQIYGGTSFALNHDANVNLPDAGITGTHESLAFDSATTAGGRVAYWFDGFQYFGFGLDAAHYFGPDQKAQSSMTNLCIAAEGGCSTSPEGIKKFNNNVTSIGFDVIMLRFPKGRLHPYLTAGPAIYITSMNDTSNFIPAGQSSEYTSLGLKLGAGLILSLSKRFGTFVEYQENIYRVKDQFYNSKIVDGAALGNTLGNAIFNTQAIIGGFSVRF